ncbi:MAG: aquaporin [Thermoleophilaceae bacterium]|nr:aquaporin [Thermoleophilaceae bacterium]
MADETGTEAGATTAAAVRIPERGPAAYVSEFIGTFVLVFAICSAVVLFAPAPVAPAAGATAPVTGTTFQDFAVIGLVHVLALFFLIQTLAVMSGAHFNPAVTAAMTVVRQITPIDAAIYILMQLAGATLGALVVKLLYNQVDTADKFGAVGFNADRLDTTVQGMGIEALGTFFLVWAIMGVAVNPSAIKDWSGLVIGGTLGFAVMIGAPMTGAGFNPARALGPAIVSGDFGGTGRWLLMYVLAPLVGALVAVFVYSWLMVTEGKKARGGAEPVG